MMAFLGLLRDKYGGVEGYMKNYLAISDDDIQIIRKNLLTLARAPQPDEA